MIGLSWLPRVGWIKVGAVVVLGESCPAAVSSQLAELGESDKVGTGDCFCCLFTPLSTFSPLLSRKTLPGPEGPTLPAGG